MIIRFRPFTVTGELCPTPIRAVFRIFCRSITLYLSGCTLPEKTILLKKGVDRGALIYMEGIDNLNAKDTLQVLSAYVPVNERTLQVASGTSLKKGDRIMVTRPSGKEWITVYFADCPIPCQVHITRFPS